MSPKPFREGSVADAPDAAVDPANASVARDDYGTDTLLLPRLYIPPSISERTVANPSKGSEAMDSPAKDEATLVQTEHQKRKRAASDLNSDTERAIKVSRSEDAPPIPILAARASSGPASATIPSPPVSSVPYITTPITISLSHARVAQKSYKGEKRFLVPPPLVTVTGPLPSVHAQIFELGVREDMSGASQMASLLPESGSALFKSLYVQGGSSKECHLCLSVHAPNSTLSPSGSNLAAYSVFPAPSLNKITKWAAFRGPPITVVSKPSRTNVKDRAENESIALGACVVLFHRINSQTVRTKYLFAETGGNIEASGSRWTAFIVEEYSALLSPSVSTVPSTSTTTFTNPHSRAPVVLSGIEAIASPAAPLTFGSAITLRDPVSGARSPALRLHKVDRGAVRPRASGAVGQLAKVCLMRTNVEDKEENEERHWGDQVYWGAPASDGEALGWQPAHRVGQASRVRSLPRHTKDKEVNADNEPGAESSSQASSKSKGKQKSKAEDSEDEAGEVVDDAVCWSIVSVATTSHAFFPPSPNYESPTLSAIQTSSLTPFPMLRAIPFHRAAANVLELDVEDLDPSLQPWLGPLGPLQFKVVSRSGSSAAALGLGRLPNAINSSEGLLNTSYQHELSSDVVYAVQDDSLIAPALPLSFPLTRFPSAGPLRSRTSIIVDLPALRDIIRMEKALPFVFVRPADGLAFDSGRVIKCEDMFRSGARRSAEDGIVGWALRIV